MDQATELRRQERQAYAALNAIREALDTLPEDHPAVPVMVQAVALAEAYWHQLRGELEQAERAVSGHS